MNTEKITKACIEAMSNDKLNELKALIIAEQIKRMKDARSEHVNTCTTCHTPLNQMMICPIHIEAMCPHCNTCESCKEANFYNA